MSPRIRSGKAQNSSRKVALPEWARQIYELRKRLRLSQAALGSQLNYSPMAVSRWERGVKEPTSNSYIRLGNLAGTPDCWAFWSRAGLRTGDIAKMLPPARVIFGKSRLPEFEIALAGGGKKPDALSKKIKLVAIPILPVHAATYGESGDRPTDLGQVPAEGLIAAPPMWNPNPGETSCLRVKGSSMSPSIKEGDLIAVDASQNDPAKLGGKIVVVSLSDRGLVLGRFRRLNGTQVLESENQEYEPLVLSTGRNRKWNIVGKVLWLLRHTS